MSYNLHEGCYGSNTCSGTVTVGGSSTGMTGSGTVVGTGPTFAPIQYPTYAPFSYPTYQPFSYPTIAPNYYDNVFMKVQCSNPNATVPFVPSQQPTPNPSHVPTPYPTFKTPTLAPVVPGSSPAPTSNSLLVVFYAAQVC
jgi:hypothetical protein